MVPWENLRARLEAIRKREELKSPAGRKPWDAVAMFKAIVRALQSLDDQVEYQLRDRLSFMRFVLWLYREQLARAGMVETSTLSGKGYLAMGGQIIDASIVPVPKQRNSRWRL